MLQRSGRRENGFALSLCGRLLARRVRAAWNFGEFDYLWCLTFCVREGGDQLARACSSAFQSASPKLHVTLHLIVRM